MHVENEIKSVGAAPFHHTVYAFEAVMSRRAAHVILVREQFVMERQAYGIRSCRSYEIYVGTGDIIILESLPEIGGGILAYKLTEHFVDKPGRVGLGKTEHIPFRIKPVAKIRTTDEKLLTRGCDKVFTRHFHKSVSVGSRGPVKASGSDKKQYKTNNHFFHDGLMN